MSYADIGIARPSLSPRAANTAGGRTAGGGSDLLFCANGFLMFVGRPCQRQRFEPSVLDDDIVSLPYMVTVTTTTPIAPLFLPDPVALLTIRLVSRRGFWKHTPSVTLDPGKWL